MNMRAPQLCFEPADELAALCKAGGDPLLAKQPPQEIQ